MTSAWIFVGCALLVFGVAGYFMSRRRGGPQGVRSFVIWYIFAWPFLAVGLCVGEYPKRHWLYFVEFGIAALGYGVQFFDFRRQRAKARQGPGRGPLGL